MSGKDDISLRQNVQPPIGELDPNSMEYATRLLTTLESIEGFIAGHAARRSIDTAIKNGNTQPVEAPQDSEPDATARKQLDDIRAGTFNPFDDKTDEQGSFAKQISALEHAGHDLSGISWKGLQASSEWSDETLKGYVAGLYGGSPLPTTSARGLVASDEMYSSLVAENSVSLKQALNTLTFATSMATKAQQDSDSQVWTSRWSSRFSRDFGLRGEVQRRFSGSLERVPEFDMTGEISELKTPATRPEVAPDSVPVEITLRRQDIQPEGTEPETDPELVENIGEVAVGAVAKEGSEPEAQPEAPVVDEAGLKSTGRQDVLLTGGEKAAKSSVELAAEQPAPEPKRPLLAEVFADGPTLYRTLKDPEVDEGIRTDARKIVQAWQELQTGLTIDTVWNDILAPELGQLAEGLPAMEQTVNQAGELITETTEGLRRLVMAIDSGDMGYMASAASQLGLGAKIPELRNRLRAVSESGTVLTAAAWLDTLTEEQRQQVDIVMSNQFYGELDENSAKQLAIKVQSIVNRDQDQEEAQTQNEAADEDLEIGASDIIEAIKDDMPQKPGADASNWYRRRQQIQDVVQFARIASNVSGGLPQQFGGLMYELEIFAEKLVGNRTEYNPDVAGQLIRGLDNLSANEIAMIRRTLILTRTYQEAI